MWKRLVKRLGEWRGIWFTAPAVAGVVVLMRSQGLLQLPELTAYDQFMRSRPAETPDDRILIVGINEEDLRTFKRWPVDDATIAKLIRIIHQQKPVAIALDLHRDLPVPPGHPELVKVYEQIPNLIAIERLGDASNVPVAPPPELKQKGQTASNDVVPDPYGTLRRGMMYITSQDGNTALESLGLRMSMLYLAKQGIEPAAAESNPDYLQLGKGVFPIFEANDGGYVGADAGSYQILLNYRGPAGSFRQVSAGQVLRGEIPSDLMRDRLVFIGPTAYSIKDFFNTPYSGSVIAPEAMPGVEVQANVASHIISSAMDGRPSIRIWSDWQETIWIVLWPFVGAGLAWFSRSSRWALAGVAVVGGALILGCYVAFTQAWWIPVVPPVLGLATSAILLTSYIAGEERRDRQLVMNLFGRHVTPAIAEAIWQDRDQLLKEGRLPGRKMTATVLFSDLKDFSGTAEHMDPETLMSWLNEYMEAMTQLVLNHGGIVDKFIGDAVMAVFGVPMLRTTPEEIARDAQNAARCAVAMAETLEALNRTWVQQHRPTTSMRVGIATGTVVTGSLGGQQRIDYTTIGDSVNIAARLESYDKSIEGGVCRILVSEDTHKLLDNQFITKSIGTVQLRGRENLTNIYQILLESQLVRD